MPTASSSPDNSRTPGRNTRMRSRNDCPVTIGRFEAEIHLVPARDFPSGRGRPTTATVRGGTGDQKVLRQTLPSQRRPDEVSGGQSCAGGAWRPLKPPGSAGRPESFVNYAG